jgi:hypothetical protein
MPPITPAGRLRALANLRQNRTWNRSAAFTAIAAEVIETKRREVEAVLQGESAGWLRPSDAITVGLLARVLVRLEAIDHTEAVDRWLRGQTSTSKPSMRTPAFIQVYLKLDDRAHRLAESLGLSPMSRNRLGIAASTGFDLAALLAAPAPGSESPAREAGPLPGTADPGRRRSKPTRG